MRKHTVSHLHTNSTSSAGTNTTQKARLSFLLPRDLVKDFRRLMIDSEQNPAHWLREQMQAAIKAGIKGA